MAFKPWVFIFCLPLLGLSAQEEDDFDLCDTPLVGNGKVRPASCPPWMITPEAGPSVCHGLQAHIKADFIYWTAREDHLAFAIKEPYQSSLGVTGTGRVLDPEWNFEPGFKVGAGVLQKHDGWDVSALYTWLNVDHTTKRTSIELNKIIVPIGGYDAAGGLNVIESIGANWKLEFNTIDAVVGRNFYISHCLTLRPFFGLKGTWQKQHFCVESCGLDGSNNAAIGEVTNKLDYWGLGIRAGLDSAWYIYRCFSFIGNVAVNALWEKFEVTKCSHYRPISAENPVGVLEIQTHYFTLKPVLELLIGFRWETWFCCDFYHFSIAAGWEEQWWADQNQFFNPVTESRQGDLYFHGLTLEFRLDF